VTISRTASATLLSFSIVTGGAHDIGRQFAPGGKAWPATGPASAVIRARDNAALTGKPSCETGGEDDDQSSNSAYARHSHAGRREVLRRRLVQLPGIVYLQLPGLRLLRRSHPPQPSSLVRRWLSAFTHVSGGSICGSTQ
jgi:hypothetical protein